MRAWDVALLVSLLTSNVQAAFVPSARWTLISPTTMLNARHHHFARFSRRLTTSRWSAAASSTSTLDISTELSPQKLQEMLETAQAAARAAGAVIRQHVGCCSEAAEECDIKYSIKDIVTVYDQQAQDAVHEIIRAQYPHHAFLGEEDVAAGGAASEQALLDILQSSESDFLWICDPIDGTANFASGLELCAVTMAVVYNATPLIGVIYDPHRDEMYSTIRGQGAFLNDRPIQVAQAIASAREAIVNAGCPADPNAFATSMRGVLALNRQTRGLRIIACSALTLAWIAAGRLTAHFGYDLSSWDLVAGALLVQEAGGRVTDLDGSDYKLTTRNMLCSNGAVHDQILKILKEADAVSFSRSELQKE